MIATVLDASVALAWLLPSQATHAADAFLADSEGKIFVAPFVFDWEVRNVLLDKLADRRVSADQYREMLIRLDSYEVSVKMPYSPLDIEPLARAEGISLFDAAYLSLAIRESIGLASRDRDLITAAKRSGVQTWDLR